MYNYWIILPCYSKINSRNWIHNNYIHFDQGSPLIAKKVQCLRPSIICNNHNYVTSGVQNQVEVTVRCTWFVPLVRKFNRYLPMIVVFPIKSWSLPLPITKSGLYLVHLDQRSMWTIAITWRPSSVNFSHFKLLLRNHLADWNRT
jgi:hypothetical protein